MSESAAARSHDYYPLLVLLEREDKSVVGVLVNNPRHALLEREVQAHCEPHEVEAFVGDLRWLPPGSAIGRCEKEADVDAASLQVAISSTPESIAGQKSVLIYRGDEWQMGLWTNPSRGTIQDELTLRSVADFHGGRISESHRNRRPPLSVARESQTLPGEYAVLADALRVSLQHCPHPELHAGLTTLCGWWNEHAPEEMRAAAVCRVYWWREEERSFVAGDPEEPAMQADQLADQPCYALFEREDWPAVAVVFYRGRSANTVGKGGYTEIYFADGSEAYAIGDDLETVDEAVYSVEGLRRLFDSLSVHVLGQVVDRLSAN